MKASDFNIILTINGRKLLLNYFHGAMDEIDTELETVLNCNDFHKLDPPALEYLCERGYIENHTRKINYQPRFKNISTEKDWYLFKPLNPNFDSTIIYCNLQNFNNFDLHPAKIVINDNIFNLSLLQNKESIIDFYLQKGVNLDINFSFALPFNDVLDRVFKYILKKGWVFLNIFSFNLLPEIYSGCPLGKTFHFNSGFISEIIEKISEKTYLQYLSLNKLIGANLFEHYLWYKRIVPKKS